MDASRRDFLKLAAVGGTAAAVFGFNLQPASRTTQSQDCPRQRNPLHLSILFGKLRRYHLLDRRPRQKRNSASSSCRRRSRPPYQSRYPLSQRRFPPARHPERTPSSKAPSAPPGSDRVGRHPWDQAIREIAARTKEDP